MKRFTIAAGLLVLSSTVALWAQNTFPSTGNVGIGTSSPATALDIRSGNALVGGPWGDPSFVLYKGDSGVANLYSGMVNTGIGTTNRLSFYTNSLGGWGGSSENMVILNTSGNVGIGLINPAGLLTINNNSPDGTSDFTKGLVFEDNTNGTGPWTHAGIWTVGSSGYNGSLLFGTDGDGTNNATGITERMRITSAGNIGIGTSVPSQKLEVNGNLKFTAGSGASVTFADGTVQSTAWNGTLGGGDYAESVDVTGGRTHYEPGDLLVIDPGTPGKFLKSTQPYSTLVSGIYSTKPGLIGRRQLTDRSSVKDEVPMAMTGIVPTKVTTENGPIKAGDLLVASSTIGRAMKGTDRSLLTGAVIGKALGNLDSGTGVIEVLVTLQ